MKALLAALLLLASAAEAKSRYDVDLIGPMDGESLAASLEQLQHAEGPEVSFRISSPGGEAISTFLFIELAKDVKAEKHLHVTCVGTVMVASAAAILFESSVCDYRVLEPATAVLFHGASGGTKGKTADQEDDLKLLRAIDFMAATIVGPRIGLTPYQYLAWIAGHDRWLASDEALELQIADEVRFDG